MSQRRVGLKYFLWESPVVRLGGALGCALVLFWLLSEMTRLYVYFTVGVQGAHAAMYNQLRGVVEHQELRLYDAQVRVSSLMHTWLGLRERMRVEPDANQAAHTVFIPFERFTSDPDTLQMAREVLSLFGGGAPEVHSNLFLVLPGQGVVFYRPTITPADLERAVIALEKQAQAASDAALAWIAAAHGGPAASLLLVLDKVVDSRVFAGQVLRNQADALPGEEGVQVVMRSRSGDVLWASPEGLAASLTDVLAGPCRQEPAQAADFYAQCIAMRYPLGDMLMIYPQQMVSRQAFAWVHPAAPWQFLYLVLLLICTSILFRPLPGSTLERQVVLRTRELADAKLKAEQASIRKSEHLANLSHEIRTPLNGLMGSLALLGRSDLPAAQLELLRGARQSSALLLDVINDMLDFSRIESGQMLLTYNRVALLQIFDQALLTVTLKAQEKDLTVTAFIAANVPEDAVVDGLCIRQVLVNLLGNAVKFTETGGICLRAEMKDGRLCVTVSDTGRGIAKKSHDLIFQPFVQGSAYDNGTGLGLAIAWRLTHMMDGELSLESDEGAGASFTLRVPLYDASAPLPLFSGHLSAPAALHAQLREWGISVDHGPSRELDRPELAHSPARLWQQVSHVMSASEPLAAEMPGCSALLCPWSLKILIVDDVAINRRILWQMLCEMGHVVEVATSVSQALEMGRTQVFDLVLMDICMPEVDGYTATRSWQAHESGVLDADTPIIALTANSTQHEHQRAWDAGMTGHLTKPFSSDELSATLYDVALRQLARGIDISPSRSLDGPLVGMAGEQSRQAAIAELMCLHERLVVAWRAGEQEAVLDALHAVKGCSGLVGMTLVSQVIEDLENQVQQGEAIDYESLCDLRRLIVADD